MIDELIERPDFAGLGFLVTLLFSRELALKPGDSEVEQFEGEQAYGAAEFDELRIVNVVSGITDLVGEQGIVP